MDKARASTESTRREKLVGSRRWIGGSYLGKKAALGVEVLNVLKTECRDRPTSHDNRNQKKDLVEELISL